MNILRTYGWHRDLPDFRDLRYAAKGGISIKSNLVPLCPPVEDQGAEGSCTAHALTGALEVLEKIDGLPVTQMSRQFLYHNELAQAQIIVLLDRGSQIKTGIKCLAKQGCCREELWPYVAGGYRKRPSVDCYADGLRHQITRYQRLDTLDDMRSCLSEGFPFVFGFSVYESFESADVAKSGVCPMPSKGEKLLGGHAVLAVGHDDAIGRFTVRNSWGPGWGMDGYFTMPYDYLGNKNLAADFWTIKRGEQI